MTAPWFIIGPSVIHGRGALAGQRILAGEVIGLSHWWDSREWQCTQLGAFHNHSRTPSAKNIRVDGKRYLVALRDLMPGDEITVDYRLQPDLEQPRADWL